MYYIIYIFSFILYIYHVFPQHNEHAFYFVEYIIMHDYNI